MNRLWPAGRVSPADRRFVIRLLRQLAQGVHLVDDDAHHGLRHQLRIFGIEQRQFGLAGDQPALQRGILSQGYITVFAQSDRQLVVGRAELNQPDLAVSTGSLLE